MNMTWTGVSICICFIIKFGTTITKSRIQLIKLIIVLDGRNKRGICSKIFQTNQFRGISSTTSFQTQQN